MLCSVVLSCIFSPELLDRVDRSTLFLAGGVLQIIVAHLRSVAMFCMLFKINSNQMHPLSGALPSRMCRHVLLVVLWLLIGTHLRLLAIELISTVEPLCPSQCVFGTNSVSQCLMVSDWQVSRAEPMLSCWHNLLFIFVAFYFFLFLPWVGAGLGSSD